MRAFFKSISFFLAVMIIFSFPISYYINNHFYTSNKQNWVLRATGQKLDYAVLGSSRVFNMIDIASLDSTFGKRGINIASSGSCYAENYLILSEFLEKNKLSTLILNTDEFTFNSSTISYPFHDYEFLPLFNKYDSIYKDYIPSWKYYLWKILPITKYCEFNNQFVLSRSNNSPWDKTRGTELLMREDQKEFKYNKRLSEIKEIDRKYFQKIILLCKMKKIKVILITTPLFSLAKQKNSPFTNYINSISSSEKIPYYNYENLFDYTNINYFKDNTHCNDLGSIEYSISLGKKLKEDNQ